MENTTAVVENAVVENAVVEMSRDERISKHVLAIREMKGTAFHGYIAIGGNFKELKDIAMMDAKKDAGDGNVVTAKIENDAFEKVIKDTKTSRTTANKYIRIHEQLGGYEKDELSKFEHFSLNAVEQLIRLLAKDVPLSTQQTSVDKNGNKSKVYLKDLNVNGLKELYEQMFPKVAKVADVEESDVEVVAVADVADVVEDVKDPTVPEGTLSESERDALGDDLEVDLAKDVEIEGLNARIAQLESEQVETSDPSVDWELKYNDLFDKARETVKAKDVEISSLEKDKAEMLEAVAKAVVVEENNAHLEVENARLAKLVNDYEKQLRDYQAAQWDKAQ